ncbi:MAG: prepilin-type N-terminal cleavage/methylation domain-containing protein [Planctomycetota bacterium]
MRNRNGISLLEVLVVIATFAMLLAIFMPSLGKVKPIARRVVCATNLKGLGTAITVYANDYDDKSPQLGKGPWAKKLGYSYEDSEFRPNDYEGPCTITSSLYLLVREADVSPKSFICPISDQVEFDGQNSKNLDIVELWDFGPNPHNHVSYVYHNPYGKFPANGERSAAFAVMADMNPWFKDGSIIPAGENNMPPQIITLAQDPQNTDRNILKLGNFQFHKKRTEKLGQGQNVLFADGHSSFEKQPNVGVKWDNIYTYWSTEENPTEQDKQGGTAPTNRSPENDAKTEDDSFLVL